MTPDADSSTSAEPCACAGEVHRAVMAASPPREQGQVFVLTNGNGVKAELGPTGLLRVAVDAITVDVLWDSWLMNVDYVVFNSSTMAAVRWSNGLSPFVVEVGGVGAVVAIRVTVDGRDAGVRQNREIQQRAFANRARKSAC